MPIHPGSTSRRRTDKRLAKDKREWVALVNAGNGLDVVRPASHGLGKDQIVLVGHYDGQVHESRDLCAAHAIAVAVWDVGDGGPLDADEEARLFSGDGAGFRESLEILSRRLEHIDVRGAHGRTVAEHGGRTTDCDDSQRVGEIAIDGAKEGDQLSSVELVLVGRPAHRAATFAK